MLVAVQRGDVDLLDVLLHAGAEADAPFHASWLHVFGFLASLGKERERSLLDAIGPAFGLEAGVERGQTPLEAALDAAGDSTLPDEVVVTPLYVAVLRGDPALVEPLLAAGADSSIAALPAGQTPLDAAVALGDAAIAELLAAA